MTLPKITVVTPSYNQGQFLEQTIKSVLEQNYPDMEYIIMDGGSTDNSVEIIKKYADKLAYWQSCPDGGQSSAVNAGFARATGEILCWLNSDDQFCPNALNTVGQYFANHPECDWLGGGGIIRIDNQPDRIILPGKIDFDSFLLDWGNNSICQPSIFWRKQLWERLGGIDNFYQSSFDYDFWLRLAKNGNGAAISNILSINLFHPAQKTQAKYYETFVETNLVRFVHGAREKARGELLRACERTFRYDKLFAPVTNNYVYRTLKKIFKND
jgi:glycosyltransferase involved in cell wall biosynthesis